jgi:hypothetical protein
MSYQFEPRLGFTYYDPDRVPYILPPHVEPGVTRTMALYVEKVCPRRGSVMCRVPSDTHTGAMHCYYDRHLARRLCFLRRVLPLPGLYMVEKFGLPVPRLGFEDRQQRAPPSRWMYLDREPHPDEVDDLPREPSLRNLHAFYTLRQAIQHGDDKLLGCDADGQAMWAVPGNYNELYTMVSEISGYCTAWAHVRSSPSPHTNRLHRYRSHPHPCHLSRMLVSVSNSVLPSIPWSRCLTASTKAGFTSSPLTASLGSHHP